MTRWMLLAEDNELDADLILRGMSAADVRQNVVVTHDGAEALDCLHCRAGFQSRDGNNPAVVLLDLKMPKVGGLEVLQQIRADPNLRHIPVVIFTSSREESDVTQSYQFGTNAYIVKPVDFKQLLSVVNEIWRHWMEINEPPSSPRGETVPAPAPMPEAP